MRARVEWKLARRSPSASRPSASESRAKSSCTIAESAPDTRASRRVIRRAMKTAIATVTATVAVPAPIITSSSWWIAASNSACEACAALSALSRENTTVTAPTIAVSATIGTANPPASWAPSRNFIRTTPLESSFTAEYAPLYKGLAAVYKVFGRSGVLPEVPRFPAPDRARPGARTEAGCGFRPGAANVS